MTHTAKQESPDVFHFWTALSLIAASCRMNIWMDRGFYKLYPNLYVIFIAESGKLRKSTAQEYGVDRILRYVPGIKLYTERMTMEGLLGQMDQVAINNGIISRDGCVYIFAPELMMLLPGDEISRKVMGFMTSVYMGKEKYGYLTKGGGDIKLENVLINFLGASASDWLETLAEDVAKGGFLARMVFITASKRRHADAWPRPNTALVSLDDLRLDLQHIATLEGEAKPTEELITGFAEWYSKEEPIHDDPRVQGFRERQHDLALRISMLLSIATSDSLVVNERHLKVAQSIVQDIESFVPQALSHIATSPQSRDAERVLAQIKRKGGQMSYTDILRANSWKLSATEVQEILRTLEGREEVHFVRSGKKLVYKAGAKP